MVEHLRIIKDDLLETRADRIGLVVLAVLVVAAVVFVVRGNPFGTWILLFLGGGLVSMTILAAASRSARWRKPVLISGVLALPVYLILWVLLMIFVPEIGGLFDPLSLSESGSLSVLGTFLYGVVFVGSTTSFGRLVNLRRSERP